MRWVPVAAHSKIIAAALVVQIVIEAAKLAVLKSNTGQTRAARDRRRHSFHHDPNAPLFISHVRNLIANGKKEPFSFAESLRRLWPATVLV
jgi:hypothetical protein